MTFAPWVTSGLGTVIDVQTNLYVASTSITFPFHAVGAGMTFECNLDTSTWAACASPKAYAGLSQGMHSFQVRAKDAAGNVDTSPAFAEWAVDTTAPTVSIVSPAADAVVMTEDVQVEIDADDNNGVQTVTVIGQQCNFTTPIWNCEGVPLEYGSQSLAVVVTDIAGNVTNESVTVSRRNPVLLVPGTTGTHLIRGSDHLWFNGPAMAVSGTDDFVVNGLSMDAYGVSVHQNVELGEVIRSTVGGLVTDSFASLENELEQMGYILNESLFYLPYDWRKDIVALSSVLSSRIEQIKSTTGAPRVDLVAHSMGGLLSKQYVLDSTRESVGKLVFVGTPHLGSPKAVRLLVDGTNDYKVLDNEAARVLTHNMPSVYELIPPPQYFAAGESYMYEATSSGQFTNQDDGTAHWTGYNAPMTYAETKTALLTGIPSTIALNPTVMAIAEDFFDQELPQMNFVGTETYAMVGCGEATETALMFDPDEPGQLFYIGYGAGDGTVPLQSGEYLTADGSKKFFYKGTQNGDHANLPSGNASVRAKIVDILTDAPAASYPDLSNGTSGCAVSGTALSWYSPVDVHVRAGGRHVGPNAEGGIDMQIPGVRYSVSGHRKFMFIPDGTTVDVSAVGTGSGTFTLLAERYEDGHVVSTSAFNSVPVAPDTEISLDARSVNERGVIWVGENGKPKRLRMRDRVIRPAEGKGIDLLLEDKQFMRHFGPQGGDTKNGADNTEKHSQ